MSNSMKLPAIPCRPPKMDGSWWRVLTKCGPLERGMANHFSILALKRREAKGKGEKERYTHLNTEFQRIARRDKKAFLSDQCKETGKQKNGKD